MARILVVDDDASLRQVLRQALERSGHEVLEAQDADAGVELCRETPPDIVLLDILMPDKAGLEMMLDLRRERSDAKIIAMSGGSERADFEPLRSAQGLGAAGCLIKPFDLGTLKSTVHRVLNE